MSKYRNNKTCLISIISQFGFVFVLSLKLDSFSYVKDHFYLVYLLLLFVSFAPISVGFFFLQILRVLHICCTMLIFFGIRRDNILQICPPSLSFIL